jgi:hypothetical protein
VTRARREVSNHGAEIGNLGAFRVRGVSASMSLWTDPLTLTLPRKRGRERRGAIALHDPPTKSREDDGAW